DRRTPRRRGRDPARGRIAAGGPAPVDVAQRSPRLADRVGNHHAGWSYGGALPGALRARRRGCRRRGAPAMTASVHHLRAHPDERLRAAIETEWAKRPRPEPGPYRLRDAARDLALVGAAAVYFGVKIIRAAWRERR